MKIKKIYLDLDGVLCDFEHRYTKLFGRTPHEARDKKEFSPDWTKFVEGENFATLPWFEGGEELLAFIRKCPVNIEILSSSGGKKFHDEVTAQKLQWLRGHDIGYKANIVPGRRIKAEYASPDAILIDDTPDVIEAFNAAGGHGILHKDLGKTLEKLKELLEKH